MMERDVPKTALATPVLVEKGDLILSSVLCLGLAAIITVGFVPTSFHFFNLLFEKVVPLSLPPNLMRIAEMASFPALALFFHLSIPRPSTALLSPVSRRFLIEISVLPILIAFFYGLALPTPSLWDCFQHRFFPPELWWVLIFAPLGEEWLFRGWLWTLIEKLWPKRVGPATNPLPLALWLTTLAFSLWHLQNLSLGNVGLVFFQVFYTLFAGFWLGYLRWKTGKLLPSIICHLALNGLSNLL